MLTHLSIKNYALIRQLELNPSASLNVVTGETGAGKSIILGAIGLLLGNRADVKALWDENEKCITEGTFDISSYSLKDLFEDENLDYENQTVIRREVSPTGKSRAFINDTPVTLDVMRKIGSRLMDVHSQFETLELSRHQFQLELIDSYAGNEKIKNDYSILWRKFLKEKKEYENLLSEATALRQESDFVKFQLDELVKANLSEEEQEKLESELSILEHAEEIKARLTNIIQHLGQSENSVNQSLSNIKSEFQSLASFSKEYEQMYQRIESARIELNDILSEAENANEKTEFDPTRAEQVNERLSLIYQLQQKHRLPLVSDLLKLQESLQERANKTSNLDGLLSSAEKNLKQTEGELRQQADLLSKSRKKIITPLVKQLIGLLKELGIPEAQMEIDQRIAEPTSSGIDMVEILFSANKGIVVRPLAQVASGGEFSRVMFSIKHVMAEKKSLPTLILDEIDSGVSGEVAIRLGNRMKEMAQRHQVIAISHLPQIAAKADAHYFVFKDNSSAKTESQIRKLESKDRITEIAKMIGGAKPSAVNIENAKELMEN
ncbi:MAG: DNA repair protein RecN [Bacteroidetes bacterium]|nr:DNA repair protein RecN [Bacteroidota bacterium]MBI3482826.1 DNA repair protein RecN [Bacteroidota bacterium]